MAESGQAGAAAATPGQGSEPGTIIAALREQGAERFDPVRFRFIEALARRTGAQRGAAREILEARLAKALADYGSRFEQAAGKSDRLVAEEQMPGGSPLADLLALIGQPAPEDREGSLDKIGMRQAEAPGELKSMRYFRSTWSKLSVDKQLAQALEKAPENAGPLNSHHLVLQSLQQMRDISPDYLKRFMSYVDALFWLDQADSSRNPGQKNAAGGDAEKTRKSARRNGG
jgi:hypothetical protein